MKTNTTPSTRTWAPVPLSHKTRLTAVMLASLTFVLLSGIRPAQAAVTYTMNSEWSDAQNPNGPWSYRFDDILMPNYPKVGDTYTAPLPSWTGIDAGPIGIVGWARSQGTELFPLDWQTGDVFGHTAGDGRAIQIRWTSPLAGWVGFSGVTWIPRDINRLNNWNLNLNGVTILASGTVANGDPYDSGNPMTFSGNGLWLNAGDYLQFDAVTGGLGTGEYIVVNYSVTLDPDAHVADSHSTLALFACGLGAVGGLRRVIAKRQRA